MMVESASADRHVKPEFQEELAFSLKVFTAGLPECVSLKYGAQREITGTNLYEAE